MLRSLKLQQMLLDNVDGIELFCRDAEGFYIKGNVAAANLFIEMNIKEFLDCASVRTSRDTMMVKIFQEKTKRLYSKKRKQKILMIS